MGNQNEYVASGGFTQYLYTHNEEVPPCRILLPAEVFLPGANLKMILHNPQVDMRIAGH